MDDGLHSAAPFEPAAAIRAALDYDQRSFRDGFGTIAAHGRLSETGKAVMDSAQRYMDGAT